MSEARVRFATEADASVIATIHVASWQSIYHGHIPQNILNNLSVKEREQQWRELIKNNVKILVIEKNNKIVGFVSLCASRDVDTNQQTCGEISALYLHPDVWHQGLGKQLCHKALIELKKMGFNEAILWVLKENIQARKFYESLGFNPTGDTKTDKYDENVLLNEVRYRKNLGKTENQTSTVILSTERLILRTWQASDIPLFAAMNADPAVMEYFPRTLDLAGTQKLVDLINQHYEKFGYTFYAVETKDTNEFIGMVGLAQPPFEIPHFKPKGLPIVEIGWRLSSQHWKKGYAIEAAKAVLHYGFTKLNFPEIISFTVAANHKSRRVMERIGLQHTDKDDFDHPNIDQNSLLKRHVLYRLTNSEYIKP